MWKETLFLIQCNLVETSCEPHMGLQLVEVTSIIRPMLSLTTASRIIKYYNENTPTYDRQTLRGYIFYATILPCRYQSQRAEVIRMDELKIDINNP